MNRTKLPIQRILVEDRQRQDLGDINDLAKSLAQYGLIQPIVVNQQNRLLAGGRRLAAATQLGWTEIDVVYRETLTADECFELELEENVRRKDMVWQEKCLNIVKIHTLKKQRGALNGDTWGLQQTGEMLGISKTHVHYCITIAKELQKGPDNPMWKELSLADAWRLLLRWEQEALQAELAKRAVEQSHSSIAPTVEFGDYVALDGLAAPTEDIDLSQQFNALNKDEAREKYLRNPLNDPTKFDDYFAAKVALDDERKNTVWLTNRFLLGDSIAWMCSNPSSVDHIITDIPYGINMAMLNQQNPHGGMTDLETVIEEHDVDYNMQLIRDFYPAAFATLKDDGYCITWCDQMVWQYMYDAAVVAGFKVQRWPITWNKTNRCMNQAAQYNFTKSTEIAIVARKGNAVMMHPAPVSVVTASNEDMKKLIGHPFAKPFECWSFLVHHVSFEGQTILEPFAGRGSGVLSMLRMSRNVIGIELNEAHYNALLENLKRYYLTINPNFKFK